MKKRLFFAFLLLATLQPGRPHSCYKCNGCENAAAGKETCRNDDPEHQNTGCMVQKIRGTGSNEIYTIKKCAVYDKSIVKEKFRCPELPESQTIFCEVCEGDLCNAGSKVAKTHFYASVVALFLVYRFCF